MKHITKYLTILLFTALSGCGNIEYKNIKELCQIDLELNSMLIEIKASNEILYNQMEIALLNDPQKVQRDYNKTRELNNKSKVIYQLADTLRKNFILETFDKDSINLGEESGILDCSSYEGTINLLKKNLDDYLKFGTYHDNGINAVFNFFRNDNSYRYFSIFKGKIFILSINPIYF